MAAAELVEYVAKSLVDDPDAVTVEVVQDQGGTVSQVQDWGIRDLAYLLAKQRRAFYVLFEYRGTSKGLLEIERNLKLMERVLRFVSVRQAENAPPTPPRPAARRPEREEADFEGADFEGMGEETP